MEDLVSIIVPIYNIEKYVKRCIDSLINQSYYKIEIVLVDDGSRDASGQICDEYEKTDGRIKVYHKCNEGVSAARNYGINLCKGSYITFVDGDDYVDKDYIKRLYNDLISTNSDIAVCAWKRVTEEYYEKKKENVKVERNLYILDAKGIVCHMLLQKIYSGGVCCVLYKRDLWKDTKFPYGKRHAEDVYVNSIILTEIDRCALTRDELYFYYTRSDSTQNACYSDDKMEEYEMLSEVKKIIDYKFPELSEATTNRLLSGCFHILFFMGNKSLDTDNAKLLINTIKKHRVKMITGCQVNKKVKFACILSFFGIKVTKIIYNTLRMRGRINI